MRFFTSDLHVGHANIIDFCGRPFRSVDEMNDALIDNWNRVVHDEDEVFVLGDFALGKIAETLPLVAELRGRKVLVSGNHDRCWVGHGSKASGWRQRYLDAGFADVVDRLVLEVDWAPTGQVVLSHFPYAGESREGRPDRYVEWRPQDEGHVLLHGHVHERWQSNGRQINVGVDVWQHTPVAENVLAALVANRGSLSS